MRPMVVHSPRKETNMPPYKDQDLKELEAMSIIVQGAISSVRSGVTRNMIERYVSVLMERALDMELRPGGSVKAKCETTYHNRH